MEMGRFELNNKIRALYYLAKVIERHFTLDKSWKGTDHACSLDPEEFRSMVQAIRQVEVAIGSPVKVFRHQSEKMFGSKVWYNRRKYKTRNYPALRNSGSR